MSTDVMDALEVLQLLDWEVTLPCEHPSHEQHHQPDSPAAWEMTSKCPACGRTSRLLLCDVGRQQILGTTYLAHPGCKPAPTTAWGLTFTPIKEA